MITFPNAKINLGLSVIRKRTDGFHDLETVFYPVPLRDSLEIYSLSNKQEKFSLHQYGKVILGIPESNLAVKAYLLLKKEFDLPPIDIHLYKNIPSGAGLGGGSADAAFMIKLLNEKFQLNLSDYQLEKYASVLGADCAFFIRNKPVFAKGIGNEFFPIQLSLKGYQIVVVKPDIFISTKEAFANVQPMQPKYSVKDIIHKPIQYWKDLLINDFECSVYPRYPIIKKIKEKLYECGAIYASMSGSGSSIFGLFGPNVSLPNLKFDRNIFYFQTILQ